MDTAYVAPLFADLSQSRYDALQLNRIEALLSQLVYTFTGFGVAPGLHMGSFTVEEHEVREPSQFVTGPSSHTPGTSSVSKSKQRRLRAAQTRKQMWSNLHHNASADSVQPYETDVNSKAKVADNDAASFDPTGIAHADSGTVQAALTDALQLVANISVTQLELYNKFRT